MKTVAFDFRIVAIDDSVVAYGERARELINSGDAQYLNFVRSLSLCPTTVAAMAFVRAK